MGASSKATFPLLDYLDELTEELEKRLHQAADHSKADDVHKGRIAARRLKAAIDVLRPVVSDKHRKPLARACKKLRRRLGPLRDADIMLLHLDEAGKTDRHAAGSHWLAEQIKGDRKGLRKKLSPKKLSRICKDLDRWSDFRDELVEAQEATDSLLSQSLHLQLDALIEQAQAHAAGSSDGDIHALRIAFKNLRYTVEMARESGHKLPAGILKAFKRIQDALGLWHDFVVIVEQGLKCSTDAQLALRDAAMQQMVLAVTDHFLRQAQAQLSRFKKLWSESGDQITESLRQQFPLEIKTTKSQKDRGRSGSKRIADQAVLVADAASNGQA